MQPQTKIKFSTKEKLIILFYILLALASALLFFRPDDEPEVSAVTLSKKQTKELVEEVKENKKDYKIEIVRLQQHNAVLKMLLQTSDDELAKADVKTNSLRGKIYELTKTKGNDSLQNTDFDSLSTLSLQYVVSADHRDSLCNEQRVLLSEMVQNKDSAFNFCDRSLKQLDSSFQILAQRHTELADQLLFTQKSLKQKNRGEKIWKGAALLLSGVTITLWLKNL